MRESAGAALEGQHWACGLLARNWKATRSGTGERTGCPGIEICKFTLCQGPLAYGHEGNEMADRPATSAIKDHA